MGKPWAKVEQNFLNHPKFLALSANAIVLWLEAKNYCDMHLTDGFVPREALRTFRFNGAKSVQQLTASCGTKPDGSAYAPLWEERPSGFSMHDYLEHNDSHVEVLERIERSDAERDLWRRRKRLYRDSGFLEAIKARDKSVCRYCGRPVNWSDRRGPGGATYDHVIPRGPDTMENIVTACRGCNSSKGNRSLEACGMTLLPVPNLVLS